MMTEAERLARDVRRALDGVPWHGSSIAAILDGVTPAAATARPIPAAHTIYELVTHMTGWTREVGRRLAGAVPAEPAEGDWPAMPARVGEPEWSAARAALASAHAELSAAVARAGPVLDAPVVTARDAALGTGPTNAEMIGGLLQHDAYHAGQIALLKKLALA